MRTLLLPLLIIAPVYSILTNASYFYNFTRPLILANRGASAYLPENTIESSITALFMNSDFIHVDVVLTKN